MSNFSEDFLKYTIQVWQKYCDFPLTLEDAREISENMTNLLTLLIELDEKYNEKEKKL